MRSFLRGALELHIVHHAADGEVHGAWMATELAHHGYKISPGTLYPEEFRRDAVELVLSSPQRTLRDVARELGVNHETLRNCVKR